MIVTEEEAKTKRCQETFGPGTSEWITFPADRNCIGSACMAWRWHNDGLSDYPPDTKGFCGKASKP
jgi:hypothetical protein